MSFLSYESWRGKYKKDAKVLAWIYPIWNFTLMTIKSRLLNTRSISSIPGTVSEAMAVLHSGLLSLESLLPLWKMSFNYLRESKSYTVGNHKSNHGSVTWFFPSTTAKVTLSSITKLEAISILKVINKRKTKSMTNAPFLDTWECSQEYLTWKYG